MDQVKRFFECLLPVTVCNLECPYCYIIQENRRNMKLADLPYSPEHIARALRQERVGGTCMISICGAGETMAQKELVPIVKALLDEGHYINITTNGTLTRRFEELIAVCGEQISRVHVSFSMHYTELMKHGWVDTFFDNINRIRSAGGSVLLQLNLCDDYVPYLDEIKQISLEKVGAYPQVALTRNEETVPFGIFTQGTEAEYYANASGFSSPLFDFTAKNFNVKRKEFCFAGDWSGVLNLQTGVLSKCYAEPGGVNIFEDVDAPIPFEAVGKHCSNYYCINSSHFMSLGVIPSLDTPTYAQLRNRPEAKWYSPQMEAFLNSKLADSNSIFAGKLRYWRGQMKPELLWKRFKKSGVYHILWRVKRKIKKILGYDV